jgi:hypothetical protein
MNSDPLTRALIAAGRSVPADTSVPAGFERRVMAAVRARAQADPLLSWIRGLWRAAIPSVGLAVVSCLVVVLNSDPDDDSRADEPGSKAVPSASVGDFPGDSAETPDALDLW